MIKIKALPPLTHPNSYGWTRWRLNLTIVTFFVDESHQTFLRGLANLDHWRNHVWMYFGSDNIVRDAPPQNCLEEEGHLPRYRWTEHDGRLSSANVINPLQFTKPRCPSTLTSKRVPKRRLVHNAGIWPSRPAMVNEAVLLRYCIAVLLPSSSVSGSHRSSGKRGLARS